MDTANRSLLLDGISFESVALGAVFEHAVDRGCTQDLCS